MCVRLRGYAQGIHLVPVVHCVGLHVINGPGGDGRCGHDIYLHIISIMEVMPQCLQLWEVCTVQKLCFKMTSLLWGAAEALCFTITDTE